MNPHDNRVRTAPVPRATPDGARVPPLAAPRRRTECTVTRSYAAPAEVVYDAATDTTRLTRWLPGVFSSERVGNGRVLVRLGLAEPVEYQWQINDERMVVTWRSDPPGSQGVFRVAEEPTGGSTVHLSVRSTDTSGLAGDLPALLAETLYLLDQEVGDFFTAG